MPLLVSLGLSLIVMMPLLGSLASSPQSPDGAEMLLTAIQGGVLHPSGLPLQGWLDQAAVWIWPSQPALALSFLSWLCGLSTVTLVLLTLRQLGVRWVESFFAAIAYAYLPTVAVMNVIPEKYALLSATQMLFVYLLVSEASSLWLGLALGLALAQHSANVILVLPFLYQLARPLIQYRGDKYTGLKQAFASLGLAAAVTFLFYLSLLWQRGSAVWPDWGHLQTLSDVIDHALRRDYGVIQLFNTASDGPSVSALELLRRDFLSWNLALVFVPLGFFALLRLGRGRYVSAQWLMMVLPGLAILYKTAMPSADLDTVMGYQERYPLLLWPILILYWGVGLSWLVRKVGVHDRRVLAILSGPLIFFAYQGLAQARFSDNNLADVYRDQVRVEMDDGGIFWTGSDFLGFYGVPLSNGLQFPVKNMIGFPWYREHVLPELSKPVARIFDERHPENLAALFRQALVEGFRIVATEPTAVLKEQDLMKQAEQTGVLWNFHSSNTSLYTKKIVANTIHLCRLLPTVKRGLPLRGQYFLREFLRSFHFAYLSAGDYLESLNLSGSAAAARAVAESLVPGATPDQWHALCEAYESSLK